MTESNLLPSWRPGATRDAIVEFLVAAESVPIPDRVAYFDNDGTLWCERPSYVQLEFFLDALRHRVSEDPGAAEQPEFAALLTGDATAMASLGLERIALALAGLFADLTPDDFTSRVRDYMAEARHAALARPVRTLRYQPMLELIEELRRRQFTVGVVTGGGTEFVRAISQDYYGVPPELVVGTLIAYDLTSGDSGPVLRRTTRVLGDANEGAAKVTNIQSHIGRAPILAAGNSGGDREMLEWACAGAAPRLALLVEHDDADREYSYVGKAETFDEAEPITDVASRLGWTVVSMARDWDVVFS